MTDREGNCLHLVAVFFAILFFVSFAVSLDTTWTELDVYLTRNLVSNADLHLLFEFYLWSYMYTYDGNGVKRTRTYSYTEYVAGNDESIRKVIDSVANASRLAKTLLPFPSACCVAFAVFLGLLFFVGKNRKIQFLTIFFGVAGLALSIVPPSVYISACPSRSQLRDAFGADSTTGSKYLSSSIALRSELGIIILYFGTVCAFIALVAAWLDISMMRKREQLESTDASTGPTNAEDEENGMLTTVNSGDKFALSDPSISRCSPTYLRNNCEEVVDCQTRRIGSKRTFSDDDT